MMAGVAGPLLLSLKVASVTSLVIMPAGVLGGLLLARRRFAGRSVVETLLALPLVLPPTAVGYLLLRIFARDGPLGVLHTGYDLDLLLTWKGAVLASAVMSLPLVARTARVAFEEVDPRLEAMSRTLGLGAARTFLEITLPLARRGILAAGLLGFARALGEFGATVIVAGNIPGRTQTLALAIFSDLQAGDDRRALALVGVTVVIAFAAVFAVERLLVRRTEGA